MIVGIDPGTTVGWAVVDAEGKVLGKGSSRELDVNKVVRSLIPLGHHILVGTDKAKIPGFVQEVATKLGARVAAPKEDLRVDEKREMTRGEDVSNAHEMDALAGALLAHRKFDSMLKKIRKTVNEAGVPKEFEKVARLVIKEELSVRSALAIVTAKEEPVIEKEVEEEKRNEDVVRVFSELSRVRKENLALRRKNDELERGAKRSEARKRVLEEEMHGLVRPKGRDEVARQKDAQINSLSARLQNAVHAQKEVQKRLDRAQELFFDDAHVVLPRLARLGVKEVQAYRSRVKHASVIFVDDPNERSESAINVLQKSGVEVLVTKLPARSGLPFACVRADEFEVFERVVRVKRAWLKKARSSAQVLTRIVQEYQKSRVNDSLL